MGVKVSVAIMAHPKRRRFVSILQKKLDRPATVVWDEKNDRWHTGRRSLLAFDPTADWHFVLQDDAVIPRHLVAGIEKAINSLPPEAAGSPLCLYYGNVAKFRRLAEMFGDGYGWLVMPLLNWGVGIVMPTSLIKDCVAWGDNRPDILNYDIRISRFLLTRGIQTWYPWPSLVDHRASPSLVKGRSGKGRHAKKFIGSEVSALKQNYDAPVAYFKETTARRLAIDRRLSDEPILVERNGPPRQAALSRRPAETSAQRARRARRSR